MGLGGWYLELMPQLSPVGIPRMAATSALAGVCFCFDNLNGDVETWTL